MYLLPAAPVRRAPQHWRTSCTQTECTLHQVSPYIGKLKSSIAADLITAYTQPGQLVADVFCGSGTIPLEAMRLGRRVFASDTNPYAMVLTRGKLLAPDDIETAHRRADRPLAKLPGDWGWAQSSALLVNTIALDRRLDILSGEPAARRR